MTKARRTSLMCWSVISSSNRYSTPYKGICRGEDRRNRERGRRCSLTLQALWRMNFTMISCHQSRVTRHDLRLQLSLSTAVANAVTVFVILRSMCKAHVLDRRRAHLLRVASLLVQPLRHGVLDALLLQAGAVIHLHPRAQSGVPRSTTNCFETYPLNFVSQNY